MKEGQTQEPVDELINEFYEAYRRFEKDPDEDETQYNRGVREGKSITYANVVSRMRNFFSVSIPQSSTEEEKELVEKLKYVDHVLSDDGYQSESEIRSIVKDVMNYFKRNL